jgi:hypothetical protein
MRKPPPLSVQKSFINSDYLILRNICSLDLNCTHRHAKLCNTAVLKLCSANPKGPATISEVIRVYIRVMAAVESTYFVSYRNNVLLQIIA